MLQMKPEDLKPQGEFTEEEYRCLVMTCEGCSKPIMYMVEPDYDLEVGIKMGLPKEIFFVEDDIDIRIIEDDSFWKYHKLSTGYALEMRCGCGQPFTGVLCRDGSEMLLFTSGFEHVERPVPEEIVPYLNEQPVEWEDPEAHPKEQTKREGMGTLTDATFE